MGLIGAIIIGILAGFIANKIMGKSGGLLWNLVLGVIGGFAGAAIKDRLPEQYRTNLTMLFGAASMGMGIASIVLMENMPAVILALILGLLAGMMMHLGEAINKGAGMMIRMIG